MTWLKTIIGATPETLEDVQAKLVAMGVDSFQTEDQRDVAEHSPGWEMTDRALLDYYAGLCRVVVYLPDTPDGQDTLAALRAAFPEVSTQDIREEDWAENWKRYYRPFPVGERLLVHPAWEPLTDAGGRAVFLNNPGATFGTGLHASTRLCLELIESMLPAGRRVLDIGCGSGILSICAMLLGAQSAVCVDIDPLAAEVCLENARRNGVELTARRGDILTDRGLRDSLGGGYSAVFSNIIADVIISLCPLVPAFLAPDGLWIASGIIDTRFEDVASALAAAGFRPVRVLERDGWVALAVTRGGNA